MLLLLFTHRFSRRCHKSIHYCLITSQQSHVYTIKSNVPNTLIGLSSGIYGGHTSQRGLCSLLSSIYLDRKCIVLPARCGAGSCSILPFSTRPLILTTVQLSRRFVPVQHSASRRYGSEARERKIQMWRESPPSAFRR